MDSHGDKSWASSPHSPAPLALQDFMSQNALSSSTHEDSASRLGTAAVEAEDQSSVQAVGVVTNKSTPLAQEVPIDPYDEASLEQEPSPGESGPDQHDEQDQEVAQDASIPDWKAIRVQVPLGKKAGKKTEWIRGWSEEILAQGDTAYCACSGLPLEAMSSAASSTATPRRINARSETKPSRPDEVGLGSLCQNCSRPVSPAVSLAPEEEDLYGGRSRGLRKKMSGLVMRVMKGRKLASPSPLGLGADGVLQEGSMAAQPPKKANNDEVLVDPDDLSSSGEEGQLRAGARLKERQERLARAQELLNKQRQ